jgi:hypothetical protein
MYLKIIRRTNKSRNVPNFDYKLKTGPIEMQFSIIGEKKLNPPIVRSFDNPT